MSRPRLSVSLGLWQDRPAAEVVETARTADAFGFDEVWVGEMATFDAFGLAAVVLERTSSCSVCVGPLAVAVRDPVQIAMGVATLTELTGRRVQVALGSSSPVVVEQWHGRSRAQTAVALDESAQVLRQLLDGGRADLEGRVVTTSGFRLRTAPPRSPLTVAAFGPGAVRVAAARADRMVLNLVTPATVRRLVDLLRHEADAAGRSVPAVAVWAAGAVDPSPAAWFQLKRGLVPYLAQPGYGEMFAEAGFPDVVSLARSGVHPRELLAQVPDELVAAVSVAGQLDEVEHRLQEYADAGADEVAVVPSATDDDPAGSHTLAALSGAAAHRGIEQQEVARGAAPTGAGR